MNVNVISFHFGIDYHCFNSPSVHLSICLSVRRTAGLKKVLLLRHGTLHSLLVYIRRCLDSKYEYHTFHFASTEGQTDRRTEGQTAKWRTEALAAGVDVEGYEIHQSYSLQHVPTQSTQLPYRRCRSPPVCLSLHRSDEIYDISDSSRWYTTLTSCAHQEQELLR